MRHFPLIKRRSGTDPGDRPPHATAATAVPSRAQTRQLACELPSQPGRGLRKGCALELNLLTATDAARAIASGEITAEDLTRSCLARIDRREPTVRAWASLDLVRAL